MQLVPCGGCRRHVDANERACPFCGGNMGSDPISRARPLLGRVSRAAVFAVGGATAACWTSGSHGTTTTGGGGDETLANKGSGQSTAEPVVPAPTTGFASIGGFCTDATTGEPVANASIQIYPGSGPGTRSVKTDARGWYEAKDLAPGAWGIQCRAPTDPGRMAPRPFYADLKAGDATRVDTTADNQDWSNIPTPYGAPPQRRRVV